MDFYEVVEKRRTIRKFKGPATIDQLERIIIAGMKAPSRRNTQNWAVVIVDELQRVLGIISERDIVRVLASHGVTSLNEPVAGHMTHPVLTCSEQHSIDWLMEQMTERRFRHIPVAEQGRLAGIVSIGDVVKHKIAQAESQAEQLRQYFVAG